MHIIWNENPLATVVQLDEFDKKIMGLRLRIEELEERISTAHYRLNSEKPLVSYAMEELDISYLLYDEQRGGHTFSQYLEKRLQDYIQELSGAHCGDCTCVASSCCKCYAETLIGINTTPNLGKHPGSYIQGAFTPRPDGSIPTLAQAIEYLGNYHPTKSGAWDKYTDAEFQQYVPRWTQEAKEAHAWLVAYQQEHFSNER